MEDLLVARNRIASSYMFLKFSVSHHTKPFEKTDIEQEKEWKLPANTSQALRRVIESLRLFTFPQDHVQPSFAKRLLSATQCYDIVDEINQMSKKAVVLSRQADFPTSGSVHVFEVEVIRSQCALKVNEKVCRI